MPDTTEITLSPELLILLGKFIQVAIFHGSCLLITAALHGLLWR